MSEYAGTGHLTLNEATIEVTLHLSGQFDPLVGCYAWTGRVDPHPDLADLIARGGREVVLRTPSGHQAVGRLSETNPWGGYRVAGQGPSPYPVEGAEVTTS